MNYIPFLNGGAILNRFGEPEKGMKASVDQQRILSTNAFCGAV
jgi:hypothetical protein